LRKVPQRAPLGARASRLTPLLDRAPAWPASAPRPPTTSASPRRSGCRRSGPLGTPASPPDAAIRRVSAREDIGSPLPRLFLATRRPGRAARAVLKGSAGGYDDDGVVQVRWLRDDRARGDRRGRDRVRGEDGARADGGAAGCAAGD